MNNMQEQEEQTEFVQYLFSNASAKIYPNNKPQHFKVQLPQPLNLPGEWEMALSSIQYPHSWNTIKSESEFNVQFTMLNSLSGKVIVKIKCIFNPGQYFGFPDVMIHLNSVINFAIKEYVEYNTSFRVYNLANQNSREYVDFNNNFTKNNAVKFESIIEEIKIIPDKNKLGELWKILGFELFGGEIVRNELATRQPSISLKAPSLFIYCPQIQYQAVGDTMAPLLALVPIRGERQYYSYERFDKPLYAKLAHSHISEIEIAIKDDLGRDIEFLAGKVFLTTHFRRKK